MNEGPGLRALWTHEQHGRLMWPRSRSVHATVHLGDHQFPALTLWPYSRVRSACRRLGIGRFQTTARWKVLLQAQGRTDVLPAEPDVVDAIRLLFDDLMPVPGQFIRVHGPVLEVRLWRATPLTDNAREGLQVAILELSDALLRSSALQEEVALP